MPLLSEPARPAGSLRTVPQPCLDVDDQLALRPWRESDAEVVRTAQLSYWVLPEARGAGVAVRAALKMTRWTFDVAGLHRLFLLHSTANLASCRVAGKLGFGVEGTLRGALLHADGWHDAHVHGRLRTDPGS